MIIHVNAFSWSEQIKWVSPLANSWRKMPFLNTDCKDKRASKRPRHAFILTGVKLNGPKQSRSKSFLPREMTAAITVKNPRGRADAGYRWPPRRGAPGRWSVLYSASTPDLAGGGWRPPRGIYARDGFWIIICNVRVMGSYVYCSGPSLVVGPGNVYGRPDY